MLDVALALVVAAAVAAGLWFLWRLLGGASRSRSRAALRIAAVVLVALAVSGYGLFQLSKARGVQLLGELVTHVGTPQKVVALTFDDGPSSEYAQQVVNVLEAHDATGTFFVIGADAAKDPAALKTLVAAGEEIGNHTWDHPRLLAMSQGAIADEIERTDAVIREAGYEGPILVRPPNGKRLLAAPWYLWRHDRTTVMWSLEPDSIRDIADDPDAMVEHVRDNVQPGDIILMHVMYEGRDASRQALPRILEALADDGYRFVTVSQLLALRED
jgi:peptidoglycan/xylan/chitin deacetylase (PgdA/CDA1 family)